MAAILAAACLMFVGCDQGTKPAEDTPTPNATEFSTSDQYKAIKLPYAEDWTKLTLELSEVVTSIQFTVAGTEVDKNSWDGKSPYCVYPALSGELVTVIDFAEQLTALQALDANNKVSGISIQNTAAGGTENVIKIVKITVEKADGKTEDLDLSGLTFAW